MPESKYDSPDFGFFTGSNVAEKREEDEYNSIVSSVVRKENHVYVPDGNTVFFAVTALSASVVTSTPAICTSFERAKQIVETNEGDIWEFANMLCVIEGFVPNRLYSAAKCPKFWYVWNLVEEKYIPIEVPSMYRNIFGFGVG